MRHVPLRTLDLDGVDLVGIQECQDPSPERVNSEISRRMGNTLIRCGRERPVLKNGKRVIPFKKILRVSLRGKAHRDETVYKYFNL